MKPIGVYKNKPLFSEKHDTIQVAKYLRLHGITFYHAPNEHIVRTKKDDNWIKTRGLLGTSSGEPDFTINFPQKEVKIELKRADKTIKSVTVAQKERLAEYEKFDYIDVYICYGFEEAKQVIDSYLK